MLRSGGGTGYWKGFGGCCLSCSKHHEANPSRRAGNITQGTGEMEQPLVLNISSSKPRAHRITNAGQQMHKSSWNVLLWAPLAQASPPLNPSKAIGTEIHAGDWSPPIPLKKQSQHSNPIVWSHTHTAGEKKTLLLLLEHPSLSYSGNTMAYAIVLFSPSNSRRQMQHQGRRLPAPLLPSPHRKTYKLTFHSFLH